VNEKMECSITDGPQYDDDWIDDETLCTVCGKIAVQHPGLCEECIAEQREADKEDYGFQNQTEP